MSSPLALPRLWRLVLTLLGAGLVCLTLLRLAFYGYFVTPEQRLPAGMLLTALGIGFKFDLRLLLLVLLPVALVGWIRPLHPLTSPGARRFWVAYLALAAGLLALVYMVDFAHFAYLDIRLDATALRFLHNLRESGLMVLQSYPVVRLSAALVLVVLAAGYAAHRLARRLAARPEAAMGRGRRVLVTGVLFLLAAAGLYGKLSYYPLRWSDAFFSNNPLASAVALNPVLYFADTFKNRTLDFDPQALSRYRDTMHAYFRLDPAPSAGSLLARRVTPESRPETPPNVVLVVLESFAFYKAGVSGNPLNPTPHFDALAREGVLFRRFYTPHGGTARSVFTLISGLPDIEPVETSSRNPLAVNQHTIVNAFDGYDKYYFLGGSASWGEIRGLLTNNIAGLKVYEEGSYSAPRVDVWGISDLDLFREAHRVLQGERRKPFFAIIQTSGNHRPYTIPADNGGFQVQSVDEAQAQKYGFHSTAAFNSYRFMDHSIGAFMEMARTGGYFDNTIFVFHGDHGLGREAAHRPAFEKELFLTRNHVPLLFYAPGRLGAPRMIDRVASEVDVLPTIAGLAGQPYVNSTFGRDLFDPRFDDRRHAFTILHMPVPHLGLIGADYYFTIKADGTGRQLFPTADGVPVTNVIEAHAETAREMEAICLGLYEFARYIRYHNAGETVAAALAAASGQP
jgi:phosphoglycerol transferase MdoB-like AlkP superfamily enzyme